MTALVIDDEELAREEMKRLLLENGRFDEIVLADGHAEALRLCEEHKIEAAFLDIEMPGHDGFKLLEELHQDIPVVFTTAHSEHAVHAFEAGVVDYLVKPIEPERLQVAIDRVFSQRAGAGHVEGGAQTMPLQDSDRVFVRDGERFWLVTIRDIEMLETCGNYTKLFFPGGPALIRKALKDFVARLDPRLFFRINRERAINLQKIVQVEASPRGHIVIKMPNGENYEMSRNQTAEFQRRMAV